jgi:hypothetical protein
MRKRQEANKKKAPMPPVSRTRNVNDMDVNRNKNSYDTRKCYRCNETGHLARNCPKKEKRQDF